MPTRKYQRKRKSEFTLITRNKVLFLTTVFVTLKLLGTIHWSWWWVFSPLWIYGAIIAVTLLFCMLVLVVVKQAISASLKGTILATIIGNSFHED